MHRVRSTLPYFRERGYEPFVLALDPSATSAPRDPLLLATVGEDVRVWRVPAWPERATRWLGVRNPALRGAPSLIKVGSRIIREQGIDLVYFSTTAFPLMTLGRYWKARFGVPYVLDLQDPWYTEYYSGPNAAPPPGGRLKFEIANTCARFLEQVTLRAAGRIITVSAAYREALTARYPWLSSEQFTVLPFGAPALDFEVLGGTSVRQNVFSPDDGLEHWVYVGRGGRDMWFALRGFFGALREARIATPRRFDHLRVHFVGTDYADEQRARKSVEQIANEHGVADLVEERTTRIPYFEALQCLREADALIVPGSDDAGYTASKIYPYVLAQRPLLAIFHRNSSSASILQRARAGTVVTFETDESVQSLQTRIGEAWFAGDRPPAPTTDWEAFAPFTAREMAQRQFDVFDACLRESVTAVEVRA
jgi:glycosyltransferase involved in cell wall biosynthesis